MDRDQIVALALSFDGLAAPHPRYVELLMPAAIETPANRSAARLAAPYTAGGRLIRPWSSCGLFARAVWRLAGCAHPILAAPYRIGRAVSDVIEIARDAGAWHEPDEPLEPGPGDVVIVGDPGHEHVLIATSVVPRFGEGSADVESIDGGQGPYGCAIARRTRFWPAWSDRWRDINDLGIDRPVRGWADTMRVCGAG